MMTKWEFTMNYPSLYLNAESDDIALLKDVKEAVEQVLRETYPNFKMKLVVDEDD